MTDYSAKKYSDQQTTGNANAKGTKSYKQKLGQTKKYLFAQNA
jgi:hypothetical protein